MGPEEQKPNSFYCGPVFCWCVLEVLDAYCFAGLLQEATGRSDRPGPGPQSTHDRATPVGDPTSVISIVYARRKVHALINE